MYIKINNESICYRLSKEEAVQLLENDSILLGFVTLSSFVKLSYSVELTQKNSHFEFNEDDHSLRLKMNRSLLAEEVKRKPSKNGIQFTHTVHNEKMITITLQVDLKSKIRAA